MYSVALPVLLQWSLHKCPILGVYWWNCTWKILKSLNVMIYIRSPSWVLSKFTFSLHSLPRLCHPPTLSSPHLFYWKHQSQLHLTALDSVFTFFSSPPLPSFTRQKLLDFLWSVKQPDGSFMMHVGGEVDVRWVQNSSSLVLTLEKL